MPKKASGEFNQSHYIQSYIKDNIITKKVGFNARNPEDMEMLRWVTENKIVFSPFVKNLILEHMETIKKT